MSQQFQIGDVIEDTKFGRYANRFVLTFVDAPFHEYRCQNLGNRLLWTETRADCISSWTKVGTATYDPFTHNWTCVNMYAHGGTLEATATPPPASGSLFGIDRQSLDYSKICPPASASPVCECGSEKTYGNVGIHAFWCPKYTKEGV